MPKMEIDTIKNENQDKRRHHERGKSVRKAFMHSSTQMYHKLLFDRKYAVGSEYPSPHKLFALAFVLNYKYMCNLCGIVAVVCYI